jgi:hypothetical protein
MNSLPVKSSKLFLILVICFTACERELRQETSNKTIILDSAKNIELSIPDSIKDFDIENAKSAMSEYLSESERFLMDTVSIQAQTSLDLTRRSYRLWRSLMSELPKISLTTGTLQNKFTRQYYIVEGDIKVDRDELLLYSRKRLQPVDTNIEDRIASKKLTVALGTNGKAALWPAGTVIKYFVMRRSFSSKAFYDSVVSAMSKATKDWMKICNIRFEYIPALDKKDIDIESYPEPVIFVVRQIDTGGDFLAQSFFPNDPLYERMLLIDNTFFDSPYDKTGVIRHELGHVLGFRHEHIWSTDESCRGEGIIQDELGALPKTQYDPYSVMHYPCGLNKDNTSLNLTAFDIEGARKIYPFE